ncbi:MAG: hypothetical protein II330_04045 [Clostridia bacterium]|nr:hypothetical protein [Clostridia bacterium]
MKNRFICLTLGMLMLLTVFLTGCNRKKDEADVEQISGITLTMWVITDKEVANTDAEMAELKAKLQKQYGQGEAYDKAVAEAEETRAAYEKVEAEITKITKSKFKVNLDIYYYTEEQYYGAKEFDRDKYEDLKTSASDEEIAKYLEECGKLTEIMILNEEYLALKETAAKALKRYLKDAKAEGRTDTEKLKKEFYAEYPQYAEFANVSDDEDEEDTGAAEELTSYNEYEIAEIVYPELRKNQVDIIYLSGFDRYNEYIENEWIQSLDEEISGASRKLTDYISSTLLSGVQIDGSTYAIPNNVSIGEYTYMMIDKELLDKYYYTIDDVEDVLDTKHFLADIKKFEPDVVPLNATYEECMSMLVWYWSLTYEEQETNEDEGGEDIGDIGTESGEEDKEPVKLYDYYFDKDGKTFSMFGTVYGGAANRNRGSIRLQFSNLFTKTDYLDILRELKNFEWEGYYGEAAEGQLAAVDFVKGDSTFKKDMEKNGYCTYNGRTYYAIIAEYPEATENELYGNMFAVSAFSHFAVGRSMDIITYLNTNSTIRNLLQYGVEGKNYEISEPSEGSVLTMLNNNYQMTLEKTGNVFMAHPGEGKRADAWEGAREQNNESLIDPLLGFDFNTMLDGDENGLDCDGVYAGVKPKDDPDYQAKGMIELMTLKSADIQARLDACTNLNELEDLITALKDELKEGTRDNAWIKKANNPAYDPDAAEELNGDEDPSNDDLTKGHSPYTIYINWLTEYGYDIPTN